MAGIAFFLPMITSGVAIWCFVKRSSETDLTKKRNYLIGGIVSIIVTIALAVGIYVWMSKQTDTTPITEASQIQEADPGENPVAAAEAAQAAANAALANIKAPPVNVEGDPSQIKQVMDKATQELGAANARLAEAVTAAEENLKAANTTLAGAQEQARVAAVQAAAANSQAKAAANTAKAAANIAKAAQEGANKAAQNAKLKEVAKTEVAGKKVATETAIAEGKKKAGQKAAIAAILGGQAGA